ncbi:MAG TPA: sialidase family protein [Candidatus Brocadiia bacterium]|nr:sialidase family protein [Candidatus Brocadiia bacterium]
MNGVRTIAVLLSIVTGGLCVAEGEAMEVKALGWKRETIYHSPQTPGYTCWTGLWKMPDGSVMICFTQATGPTSGWRPGAPPAIRQRLCWPPPAHDPNYDMTGLVLENIHMRSTDGGETWVRVSADPFSTCMNGCATGERALPDGTVLRAVWGQGLPYWDVPQSGYIQRSTDGTKTWGPPEPLSGNANLQTWPTRIRMLSDGRITVTGAANPFVPDKWTWSETLPKLRACVWVSRDKLGREWSEPIYAGPPNAGYGGEEFDTAELDNGDLLAVYRTASYDKDGKTLSQERRQNLFIKEGDSWEPTPIVPAPFPHSGHPELLATREGPILHIAQNGIWWAAGSGAQPSGARWTKLDVSGSAYYPHAVQLNDGTIMVVSHVGSDDPYGKVDQSIVMDTFRLEVRQPK